MNRFSPTFNIPLCNRMRAVKVAVMIISALICALAFTSCEYMNGDMGEFADTLFPDHCDNDDIETPDARIAVVDKQVQAYNERDIEKFVSCFSEDIIVQDGAGNIMAEGHDAIHQMYGAIFASSPQLHCEILNRMEVGQFVIDEELVTGITMEGFPDEVNAAAVYRVEDNLITQMTLYN